MNKEKKAKIVARKSVQQYTYNVIFIRMFTCGRFTLITETESRVPVEFTLSHDAITKFQEARVIRRVQQYDRVREILIRSANFLAPQKRLHSIELVLCAFRRLRFV